MAEFNRRKFLIGAARASQLGIETGGERHGQLAVKASG